MQSFVPAPLLRHALLADAAVSGLMGLAMVFDAPLLEHWFAIPAHWLRYAGVGLLPYAAIVAFLATRPVLPRAAVWAVIVCNAMWAIDCMLLLMGGWLSPALPGRVFVMVQAWGVLMFGALQWLGLRRSTAGRQLAL
jgi:hypothetical protein